MKRTPLKRKTPLKPKTGFKKHKKPKKKVKRSKLPSEKTVRNKCDSLLTPIVKKKHPNCLLRATGCAGVTQLAHHHVHKSKSTRLRYDMRNLIPLCGHCHVVLHQDESFWGSVVTMRKTEEDPLWFAYIEQAKRETVKADVHYYLNELKRLQEIHDSL